MCVDIIYCILLLCACETGEKEIKQDEVNGAAILGREGRIISQQYRERKKFLNKGGWSTCVTILCHTKNTTVILYYYNIKYKMLKLINVHQGACIARRFDVLFKRKFNATL